MIEYRQLWNEDDARIPEVVTEASVWHDEQAPGGEVRGHDGLEEWMREFTSAFPDFHVEELDMLSRDDTVMVEATYTMTHEGAFGDVPPTGRDVEVRALAKFLVEDGKLQQHREYRERLEILEQLGVVDEERPPAGPTRNFFSVVIDTHAMEYFVTGGTGFIGTRVVEQLVEEGHDVIAVTRSRANASHLPGEVEVVEADITDRESLREPMAGVDGVFHMAAWFYIGPGPRNRETAERINVEGTRNVLELMDELDIPKGVYTSTIAVFGDTDGKVVDETHRPDDPGLCVYFRTKWRAHYEVAKPMMEDGLPLVVVQPGGVFGPGDKEYGSVRAPFLNWFQDDLPMLPRGFALPFDYVEDTARARLLAMENGEPGEEYIIASEPRETVDVFERAAEMTGRSPPRAVSPVWFQLLARVMRPVEMVTTPPEGFEPEVFRTYGGTEILVDNSKAKEELGIEHRPFEEGLREYLEWEMNQQNTDTDLTERTTREAPTDTTP